MNWYIGQEIVAIKNSIKGCFKIGDTFVIKALRVAPCTCKNIDIDVRLGMRSFTHLKCKCGYVEKTDIRWCSESCFAPLDSLMSEEIKELLTDLPQHLQNIENEKIYLETKKNYKDNGIYEDNETNDD